MNEPNKLNNVRGGIPSDWELQLVEGFGRLLTEIPWLEKESPALARGVGQGREKMVAVRLPQGPRLEFLLECKVSPRAANLPIRSITRELGEGGATKTVRVPVLLTPLISPRLAEICQECNWAWMDFAGNCHVSVPPFLHIERTGRRNLVRRLPGGANLGTPGASRIVRALFQPSLQSLFWTQRDLQEQCRPGVSLGLVNMVLRHLQSDGFVREDETGAYRVVDSAGLLRAWRQAYEWKRVRQVRLFTLRRPQEIEAALERIGPHGETKVAWAAFSAAEQQAPAVRQPKMWLMVSPDWTQEVLAALEAKSVDSGDNLVVLLPPDDGPFFAAERREGRLPCTSPIQTYVDVSQLAGRGEEAAEALLQQVIRPAWEARSAT